MPKAFIAEHPFSFCITLSNVCLGTFNWIDVIELMLSANLREMSFEDELNVYLIDVNNYHNWINRINPFEKLNNNGHLFMLWLTTSISQSNISSSLNRVVDFERKPSLTFDKCTSKNIYKISAIALQPHNNLNSYWIVQLFGCIVQSKCMEFVRKRSQLWHFTATNALHSRRGLVIAFQIFLLT